MSRQNISRQDAIDVVSLAGGIAGGLFVWATGTGWFKLTAATYGRIIEQPEVLGNFACVATGDGTGACGLATGFAATAVGILTIIRIQNELRKNSQEQDGQKQEGE